MLDRREQPFWVEQIQVKFLKFLSCISNALTKYEYMFFPGGGGTSHMDDEYRWAGVEDPKIMITTSHDPSSRLKMFVKVTKTL
jgi:hypothetical protein